MPYENDWTIDELRGSEDEDEELARDSFTNRDAIIFLIEATETLFSPCDSNPNGRSNAQLLLATILYIQKKKIVSSSKDQIGLVFFNTQNTKKVRNEGWEHVYIFQDVTPLDVEHIKSIKNFLYDSADPQEVFDTFGKYNGPSVLAQAVKGVSLLLRSRVTRAASRRIILITDNDDPFWGSDTSVKKAFEKRCRVAADDLSELDMYIEPVFLPPPSKKTFDVSAFYSNFLETHLNLNDSRVSSGHMGKNGQDAASMIKNMVRVSDGMRRAGFTIPFLLGENMEIGISGYNLVSEEKRKAYAWYDDETRQGDMVGVKTIISDPYTHDPLDPKKDLVPYYPIGGKGAGQVHKALLSHEELKKLKTFGIKPCLKLLGFKDRSEHRFQDQVKHAYFIYPNEKEYTGSKRTFLALLRSMTKKNKIGVGLFLPRTTSTPTFVHIFPQEERREGDHQIKPPGFQIISLPFADEIRPPGIDETRSWVVDTAHEEGGVGAGESVNRAKNIISNLTSSKEYDPDNYPNPDLNWHYDLLAAIALDDDIQEPEDFTLPDYEKINNRVGDKIEEFKAIIETHPNTIKPLTDLTTSSKHDNKKRNIAGEKVSDQTRQKGADEIGEQEIRSRFESNSESKLKVADLKAFLSVKGQPTSGKKDDLIERIRKIL